jgi:Na+/melibiose symporter-like transporter
MVPYETLATEMTDDFSLRSKLTGYKAIFGKLANFLAAFIPDSSSCCMAKIPPPRSSSPG